MHVKIGESMSLNKKIAGVFVAFYPEFNFIDKLSKFSSHLDLLVVYDNTEYDSKISNLREEIDKLGRENITYIGHGENIGIAAALNKGVRECFNFGVTHIFLFDQDSDVQNTEYFDVMVSELDTNMQADPALVSLCPNILDEANPEATYKWLVPYARFPFFFSRINCFTNESIYPLVAITSGSLFHIEIFRKIGFFKEEYFIDYVDTEYCLRLINNGYKIKVCKNVTLIHNLGARTKVNIFGIDFSPTNHSAIRRYYIARNSIDMWRNFGLSNPAWAMFDLTASLYNAFRIVFFESNRLVKIKYSLDGFIDGFYKNMGKKKI